MVAEEVEGPITEELGVFFRSLGAVSFSAPDAAGKPTHYAGDASVVCAAASAGVVFFADNTGLQQNFRKFHATSSPLFSMCLDIF